MSNILKQNDLFIWFIVQFDLVYEDLDSIQHPVTDYLDSKSYKVLLAITYHVHQLIFRITKPVSMLFAWLSLIAHIKLL